MSSAITSALLYSLLPFLAAALTLLLLLPLRPLRSQLRHFLLSLSTLPILDLTARLYPLQPFFPLLLISLLLLLSATLGLSLLFHFSSIAFANIVEFISAFFRSLNLAPFFALVRPFDDFHVPPQLASALHTFLDTLREAETALNTTQLTQCASILPGLALPTDAYTRNTIRNTIQWHQFKAYIRSIVLCPSVLQSVPAVNVALNDLLSVIDVADFFNSSTLPAQFRPGLDQLTAAVTGAAEHLNLTQVLAHNELNPGLTDSLARVPDAFQQLRASVNFTAIFAHAAAKPAAQEALATIRAVAKDPKRLATIAFPQEQFQSPASLAREFLVEMPMSARVGLLMIAAAIAAFPLLFLVRAAAVEAVKTVLTQRYERATPPGERDVSGWLRAAAISSLGVAIAEALPFCALFGAIGSTKLASGPALAVHALAVVPLHVVSQLRVAEAMARRDVLKDGGVKVWRAFMLATVLHAFVGMWWNWCAMAVVALGSQVCVLVDLVPVVVVVWWGRRICQRVISDEKNMIEERARKKD